MKMNHDFLKAYVAVAPLALAFERTLECQLYMDRPMDRPILDIGCGEGLFAKVLFAEAVDTGVDPNPRELERAKDLGGYKELIQCEGAAIPKSDGAYQTIFSNSVLEHIRDLEPVLREAYRLLAPGGRFYFTVPSEKFDQYSILVQVFSSLGFEGLTRRYRRFYNHFWRHYHYYPVAGWRDLAEKTGFDVIDAFAYASKRICLMNDLLAACAFPRLVLKRITNRWVLFPRLRSFLMLPVYLGGRLLLKGGGKDSAGGLVFVALTKR